jgi:hypothetical protein
LDWQTFPAVIACLWFSSSQYLWTFWELEFINDVVLIQFFHNVFAS